MPKETKFTLALMLFLAVALGFVVWQRVSKDGESLASLKENMNKPEGEKTPSVTGSDSDGHDHGSSQNNEPGSFPVAPLPGKQVASNLFDDHDHDHGDHQDTGNPFAQTENKNVAPKPAFGLFEKPITKPVSQTTFKPESDNPFGTLSPKTSTPSSKPPANLFDHDAPDSNREEAPKPNPFAKEHDHSGRVAHQHDHHPPAANPGQSNPFNPFDNNSSNKPQPAGTVSVKSATFSSPFPPVHQASQSNAQNMVQNQNDPFGNIPIPSANEPAGFPAAHNPPANSFDSFHPPTKSQGQGFAPAPVPTGGFNTSTQQEREREQHRLEHHPKTEVTGTPFNPAKYTPSSAVVSTGPTRVYTVKPDETYWAISKKIYGTIRYFQALEEHNRSRISSAKKLRPGMKVLVPEEKFLLASYTQLIPGAGRSASSVEYEQNTQGLFFDSSGRPMFRIGAEDTLGGIAYEHLGRTTRWVEIFNLNRDSLKTPDRLKIGTVLRMPADASRIALAPESTIRR